ncbi:MAG TPA: hypothetical protein VFU04_08825 [Solirubrobacterales bacterium]|nr:hypothetical protein [Solirubrobacterales bacterium]
MGSNLGRIALGIVAVAAAVVLFVVLQGDDGSDTENGGGGDAAVKVGTPPTGNGGEDEKAGGQGKPAVPTIVVRNGAPVGGVQELSFEAGERIRFDVRSDSADELHVHGYDVERALPAGKTVRVDFPASIEGLFEAELHESGEQIAELRIEP